MTDAERIAATDRLRGLCVSAGIRVSLLDLVRERDVALLFAVSTRTLRAWRHAGTGPTATKIGSAVWFSVAALTDYLRQEVAEGGDSAIDLTDESAEDAGNQPPIRIARK